MDPDSGHNGSSDDELRTSFSDPATVARERSLMAAIVSAGAAVFWIWSRLSWNWTYWDHADDYGGEKRQMYTTFITGFIAIIAVIILYVGEFSAPELIKQAQEKEDDKKHPSEANREELKKLRAATLGAIVPALAFTLFFAIKGYLYGWPDPVDPASRGSYSEVVPPTETWPELALFCLGVASLAGGVVAGGVLYHQIDAYIKDRD